LSNVTIDVPPTLAPLSAVHQFVIDLMRGERSSFKCGYSHANAVLATVDLCEIREIPLTDSERLLLPSFALGVARGLGSETATLEHLARIWSGDDDTTAVEAYNSGMIYGSWEKCLGDTFPADQ
jgi:hypothetical protein